MKAPFFEAARSVVPVEEEEAEKLHRRVRKARFVRFIGGADFKAPPAYPNSPEPPRDT